MSVMQMLDHELRGHRTISDDMKLGIILNGLNDKYKQIKGIIMSDERPPHL